MACPTCGHDVRYLGGVPAYDWCPRCGTLTDYSGEAADYHTPHLVGACRTLAEVMAEGGTASFCGSLEPGLVRALFRQLGISDAIHKPEDRPT